MEKRVLQETTVELKCPVEHSGKNITELTLRTEATVADLEAMDGAKGEVEKTIRLISELSGASLVLLRKLRPVDYFALSKAVGEILGNESPATGGTS